LRGHAVNFNKFVAHVLDGVPAVVLVGAFKDV
jgi:hypothetical protein